MDHYCFGEGGRSGWAISGAWHFFLQVVHVFWWVIARARIFFLIFIINKQDLYRRKHLLELFCPWLMAPIARIISSIFCCAGVFFGNCPTPSPLLPPKIGPSPRRFYISHLREKRGTGMSANRRNVVTDWARDAGNPGKLWLKNVKAHAVNWLFCMLCLLFCLASLCGDILRTVLDSDRLLVSRI